jgi:hypothetical protein
MDIFIIENIVISNNIIIGNVYHIIRIIKNYLFY